MKTSLFYIIFLVFTSTAFSQASIVLQQKILLENANRSFIQNDSIKGFDYLYQYVVQFPKGFESVDFAIQVLQKVYDIEKIDNLLTFLTAFIENPIQRYNLNKDNYNLAENILFLKRGSPIESRIAMKVAEIYAKNDSVERVNEFVQMAFDKIPKDCGNGYFMYKKKIAYLAAKIYLQLDKIDYALQLLLDDFLNTNFIDPKYNELLKSILFDKYSSGEIAQFIEEAIESVEIDSEKSYLIHVNLFENPIEIYKVFLSTSEAKEYLKEELKFLLP